MKLLIADDGGIRRLLRLTLECTHELIEAADGAEALLVLFRERPDVPLLDVAMPIIDGLSARRAVRADTEFDRLDIVFISANAADDEAPAGADRYFPKRFRLFELPSAMEEVAAQRQAATPNRRSTILPRLLDAV